MYEQQRSKDLPPRPPIGALAPPCERCGHSGFVHEDRDGHACLYAECSCAERDNLRVLPVGRNREQSQAPREEPETLRLTAHKGSGTLRVTLPARQAVERAASLEKTGWNVDLEPVTSLRQARERRV